MSEPATQLVVRPRELVFDLECVSNWDALSDRARAALWKRHADAEARLPIECRGNPQNNPEERAALDPWSAKVIVAAIYNPGSDKGMCFYEGEAQPTIVAHPWQYRAVPSEGALLEAVWSVFARNPDARLVSYNGRGYDGPMLHVRSMVNRVRATRNAVPYRYSTKEHADLHDLLGAWGATKAPSLEVVCEALGIETPKHGLCGAEVGRAYREGRVHEIARYCAEDVRATSQVLARWEETVGPVFGERRKW